MRIIKKYSNRRLYDTTDSAYVNLEDLARLVRQGEEVRIVDAKTDADLTRGVLLQVVLEVQDGARLFPVGLLHRIIRLGGDHPLQRAALQQVGAGLEVLDAQISQVERSLGWAGGFGARPGPDGAAPKRPAPEPPAEEETEEEAETPPPAAPKADQELDALRARLAALEERLKR